MQRPDGQRVLLDYDALARRIRKVVLGTEAKDLSTPGHEVSFVWDGHVPLHEVASTEGLSTWLFEPESFSPLAKEDATGRYAVVTDHLGTPTEMYDELGQLAWRMQLDTFGVGQTDVALQHCPWRWPGQYEDEETSLLYNRFRYYDAYAGRYISQDPLGLEAGPHLYGYPEDPLSSTDPLGLNRCGKGYQAGPRISDNLLLSRDKFARGVQQLTEARRTVSKSAIAAERKAFLGDNLVKVGPGKWRSVDGHRQFRVKPNDYAGDHGTIGPHVHFEFLQPNAAGTRLEVWKNVHVPLQ